MGNVLQGSYQCRHCAGKGEVVCQTCASAGYLAEIPVITAQFSVEHTKFLASENPVEEAVLNQAKEVGSTSLFNQATDADELPAIVNQFDGSISNEVRQKWQSFAETIKGRIQRRKIEANFVPCATCQFQYEDVAFNIYIVGSEQHVIPASSTPKDQNYLRLQELYQLRDETKSEVRNSALPVGILSFLVFFLTVGYLFYWSDSGNTTWIVAFAAIVLCLTIWCFIEGVGDYKQVRRMSNEIESIKKERNPHE